MPKKKVKHKKIHDKKMMARHNRVSKKLQQQILPFCQSSGTAENERFNAPDEPCDDGSS